MTPPPPTSSSRPGCAGDGCFAGDPWPLHYVRPSSSASPTSFRRLCTGCVLRSHLGLFCTSCFGLLDSSPDQSAHPSDQSPTVRCLRCPAVAHRACAAKASEGHGDGVDEDGFLCPSCAAPAGFSYFPPSKYSGEGSRRVIDETSARVLLAAARLAAASMSRAAAAARADADRKVKESALARKRAREMLDNVFVAANGKKEKSSIAALKKGSKGGSLEAKEKASMNDWAKPDDMPPPEQQSSAVVAAAAALGVVLPRNNSSVAAKSFERSASAGGMTDTLVHGNKPVEAEGMGSFPPSMPTRVVGDDAVMAASKTRTTSQGAPGRTEDEVAVSAGQLSDGSLHQ